jgi:chromosome partitioning protein
MNSRIQLNNNTSTGETKMGKVISLVNPKGGSGKSTLTLCLADVFTNSIIVDLDAQASLWSWFQERSSNDQLERSLPVEFYGLEPLPLERLDALAENHDYVFIDCPGESEAGEKTRMALVYSDLVIIPVNGSDFDITSLLNHLAPLLEDAASSNLKEGKIRFLPTFVHPSAKLQTIVDRFEGLGVEVFQEAFRARKVLKIFSEGGLTLSEFVDNGRFVVDRVQALEALINVRRISQQITFQLNG